MYGTSSEFFPWKMGADGRHFTFDRINMRAMPPAMSSQRDVTTCAVEEMRMYGTSSKFSALMVFLGASVWDLSVAVAVEDFTALPSELRAMSAQATPCNQLHASMHAPAPHADISPLPRPTHEPEQREGAAGGGGLLYVQCCPGNGSVPNIESVFSVPAQLVSAYTAHGAADSTALHS